MMLATGACFSFGPPELADLGIREPVGLEEKP